MKILYFECFSGISGDMSLGALVDLGVDFEYLKSELSKLSVKDEFILHKRRSQKKGISGTKIDVEVIKDTHNHSSCDKEPHIHHYRNFCDIKKIIESSSLDERVKASVLCMFSTLRDVEAKIHNKAPNDIHFHEVGAIDSIVDIIGTAICLEYLKSKEGIDKIICSKVELGGGFTKCEHGVIAIPAPATLEILKNVPISLGKIQEECTTPTGALILRFYVDEFVQNSSFTPIKIGYGLGSKDFEIPNLLRVIIGESDTNLHTKEVLIETNIDDMNPEILSFIEERLFSLGALDVYKCPITTKKNRLGVKLSVLATIEHKEKITEFILTDTTSIGVRKQYVDKIMLKRESKKIETEYGNVSVKFSFYEGRLIKYKAEYEDCKTLAIKHNISIKNIYDEVDKRIACLKNMKN